LRHRFGAGFVTAVGAPSGAGTAMSADPKAVVEEFLRIVMIPDPQGARVMHDISECSAFNAGRYRWVKKRFERTDVVQGANDDEAVVYNIGTLYGEWPDGTPFAGNRYVDRYVLRHGKIVEMEVWNDSAERMLLRAGLCEPWPLPQ
jgi:hypothetical protein